MTVSRLIESFARKQDKKYLPPKEFQQKAAIKSLRQYKEIYKRSVSDPEEFWAERARELH